MIEVVWRRINQTHAPNYIALISIIQSANIGFLIYVIESSYSHYDVSSILIFATTVIGILSVWHEYAIGGYCFTWVPGLRDTLIPFCLGFFEYMMIRSMKYEKESIDTQHWYFWAALFSLAALAAYLNMFKSAEDIPSENQEVLNTIRSRPDYTTLIKYFLLGSAAVFYFYSHLHSALEEPYQILLSGSSLVMMISMVVLNRSLYWKRIVGRKVGILNL